MSAMMQCLSVASLAVLLLLLECSSYGAAQFQCESGEIFTDNCTDGAQSCFNKEKTARFTLPFDEPPTVAFGFMHLDLVKWQHYRVRIISFQSTAEQLSVTFNCWAQSRCVAAGISWMACGPVKCGWNDIA